VAVPALAGVARVVGQDRPVVAAIVAVVATSRNPAQAAVVVVTTAARPLVPCRAAHARVVGLKGVATPVVAGQSTSVATAVAVAVLPVRHVVDQARVGTRRYRVMAYSQYSSHE
jgi:hypothetical protein